MTTDLVARAADLANRPDGVMLLTTMGPPPGWGVAEVFGLVRGNTIRARHVGHDIMAGLKSLFGGELSEYTKLMAESREQALDRLRAETVARGGNAVLGLQMTTSMVIQGSAELLVYGTAVRLVRSDAQDPASSAR